MASKKQETEIDRLFAEIKDLPKKDRDTKLKEYQKRKTEEVKAEIARLRQVADQEEKEKNRRIEKQKVNAKLIFAGITIRFYPQLILQVFQETAKHVEYSTREVENIKVLLTSMDTDENDIPEFKIKTPRSKTEAEKTAADLNALLGETKTVNDIKLSTEKDDFTDPFDEQYPSNDDLLNI